MTVVVRRWGWDMFGNHIFMRHVLDCAMFVASVIEFQLLVVIFSVKCRIEFSMFCLHQLQPFLCSRVPCYVHLGVLWQWSIQLLTCQLLGVLCLFSLNGLSKDLSQHVHVSMDVFRRRLWLRSPIVGHVFFDHIVGAFTCCWSDIF